jgi:hypothetical protein
MRRSRKRLEARLRQDRAQSAIGIRPAYSVTPGSLTLWSVQVLRRIHRSTAPASASNAAIKPNALAANQGEGKPRLRGWRE